MEYRAMAQVAVGGVRKILSSPEDLIATKSKERWNIGFFFGSAWQPRDLFLAIKLESFFLRARGKTRGALLAENTNERDGLRGRAKTRAFVLALSSSFFHKIFNTSAYGR